MSAALVHRLFLVAGAPSPPAATARTLARAPRPRLVRAVAWYALAAPSLRDRPERLLPNLRLVIRGWDDVYGASSVPPDAARATLEAPSPGHALVIRHGRAGRGWEKGALLTTGPVRAELALAVRWLGSLVGCVVHDDCAAIPELGAACAAAQDAEAGV